MSFLDRFFGPSYEKALKEVQPSVDRINGLEATYQPYTEAQIIEAVQALRKKVVEGEATLDAVLPEMFAVFLAAFFGAALRTAFFFAGMFCDES